MLKLMIAVIVWLSSMSFYHWSFIHTHYQEIFHQLTPSVLHHVIRVDLSQEPLILGFDEVKAQVYLSEWFSLHHRSQYGLYHLHVSLFLERVPCSQFCDEIVIELVYNYYDFEFILNRRFVLYAN